MKKKINVGLLFSATSTDEEESRYLPRLQEMLNKQACNVVEIDFHKEMIDFHKTQPEGAAPLEAAYQDKKPTKPENFAPLKITEGERPFYDYVKKMVKDSNLNIIVFPGDSYDVVEPGTINPSSHRMDFEKMLLIAGRELGIPILAICGGMQHIAFFCGAEIIGGLTGHKPVDAKVNEFINHDIEVVKGSAAYGFTERQESWMRDKNMGYKTWDKFFEYERHNAKTSTTNVNSLHGQGVKISKNRDGTSQTEQNFNKNNLDVVATANATNKEGKLYIAEVYEGRNGAPLLAFQEHPECMENDFNIKVIDASLGAGRTHALRKEVMRVLGTGGEDLRKKLKPAKANKKETFVDALTAKRKGSQDCAREDAGAAEAAGAAGAWTASPSRKADCVSR